jgi:ribosomal protein L24E
MPEINWIEVSKAFGYVEKEDKALYFAKMKCLSAMKEYHTQLMKLVFEESHGN